MGTIVLSVPVQIHNFLTNVFTSASYAGMWSRESGFWPGARLDSGHVILLDGTLSLLLRGFLAGISVLASRVTSSMSCHRATLLPQCACTQLSTFYQKS